jgi:class 3 adenylate cyclase
VTLRARVDRHKCIGAGNCITLAPTAFDWLKGDFGKAEVLDVESVEEEQLREAALSCPTLAIEIEEVEELLPWQLRGKEGPRRRVVKTFMFTDIVGSTNLAAAMGDDAWGAVLGWHDDTMRKLFMTHCGEVVKQAGDGFFVAFDDATEAVECAVDIQNRLAGHRSEAGFAPQVRIGLHCEEATRRGRDFEGMGVHKAARITDLAEGGQILVSREVLKAASVRFPASELRAVELNGVSHPVEVASIAVG